MTILVWDKPKKVRSKKDWEQHGGFDGGPTGGYIPNMSDDDAKSWKAKITGTKLGFPQVEIRKQTEEALILLIVNLGAGYNYKTKSTMPDFEQAKRIMKLKHHKTGNEDHYAIITDPTQDGINVHMSMNGPCLMSFQDMRDMQTAIDEATVALEALEKVPGQRYRYFVQVDPNDIETMAENISNIPGVRKYYQLPLLGYIAISAPQNILSRIETLPGVVGVLTYADTKKIARKATGW